MLRLKMHVPMSENPKTSIIINNYNYGRFLADAIESALAQTYQNTEIIVVDDGSTDESRDLIGRYGNRIIAVLKGNGGQASAYNAGFAVATGDIVCFLDSDDTLSETAMTEAAAAFQDSQLVKVEWQLEIMDAPRSNDRRYRTGEAAAGSRPSRAHSIKWPVLRLVDYASFVWKQLSL